MWKLLHGDAVRHPAREDEVRQAYATRLRPAGWPQAALDHLLDGLLDVSRRIQSSARIAIQGAPGSWSEESLHAAIPGARLLRCRTVESAWAAVVEGRAAAAWLAARNSTTGDIGATAAVRAVAEVWHEHTHGVRHALLTAQGTALGDVRAVAGHPQALAQCASTLARVVPAARLVASVDGAHSARSLRAGDGRAVVASARVAHRRGLAVLVDEVCDRRDNATTFQLLVPAGGPRPG